MSAHRAKQQEYHPDKFLYRTDLPDWVKHEAEEKTKLLNEAWSVLGNPTKRKAYDEQTKAFKEHSRRAAETASQRREEEERLRREAAERIRREEAERRRRAEEEGTRREAEARRHREEQQKLRREAAERLRRREAERRRTFKVAASIIAVLALAIGGLYLWRPFEYAPPLPVTATDYVEAVVRVIWKTVP
jgi:curved DNA-binding protein CbpA